MTAIESPFMQRDTPEGRVEGRLEDSQASQDQSDDGRDPPACHLRSRITRATHRRLGSGIVPGLTDRLSLAAGGRARPRSGRDKLRPGEDGGVRLGRSGRRGRGRRSAGVLSVCD